MKLRPARMADTLEIVDIIVERHKDSRYAGVVEVDEPLARKVVSGQIQRHGGTNAGGTFVMVAEDDEGKIAAFIMASLSPIYGIGDKLAACDDMILCTTACPAFWLVCLFAAYVAWADDNPKVIEVGAMHNDAFDGSEQFAGVFKRHGMRSAGTLYLRSSPSALEQEKAA